MKKIFLIAIFISTITFAEESSENKKTNNKDLILELKPQSTYDESSRYDEVEKYDDSKEKKDSNVDIDIDINVNKEEKKIDKLKLDMGTNF